MLGTLGPQDISTGLQRVAELSRQAPGMVWSTLSQHITLDLLKEAYRLTRKDGAVGIDGQTAKDYEEKLEENLGSLLERLKSGSYQAPPVRRVYIPKGDGTRTRPMGIPTFEDKVLQRAVVMVLEAVYEQDFLDCSYGFRPGRSAHQALKVVWDELMRIGGGFVLELDIQEYFDTILGGLHVMATERHEARRIDRQLFGRCGRQGDPGTAQALVSLEDELAVAYLSRPAQWLARMVVRNPGKFWNRWVGKILFRRAQSRAELLHARMRRQLLKMDEQLEDALAFSGQPE